MRGSECVGHDPNVLAASTAARIGFLDEAETRIARAHDLEQIANALASVLIPRFAAAATVSMVEEVVERQDLPVVLPQTPKLRRLAASGERANGSGGLPALDEVVGPNSWLRGCLTSKQPVTAIIPDGHLLLAIPLVIADRVIGVLCAYREEGDARFDDVDMLVGKHLARSACLALDGVRLRRSSTRPAHLLQSSMLARRAPDLIGVDAAYRYLASDADVDVGGDWFDVIPLSGSRVALVVGDIMGHGLHAAAAMGQFRTAVGTLASLDLPPEQVLRHLDALALWLSSDYPAQPDSESHLATCLYLVYDPATRRCEIANAGHVPPVLVHPDGRVERLELPYGAPIGIGGVAFGSMRLDVADGSRLVLCTDSLVDVRGAAHGRDLETVCARVAASDRPVAQTCEDVAEALWTPERRDDLAVLVARFTGVPAMDVVSWTLPDIGPAMVGEARRRTRSVLDRWGLAELVDSVELLVSELVTNALRHGRQPISLRLLRAGRLVCEVHDDGHLLPVLVSAGPDEEGGRGIQLVSRIADRWGTSRTARGKVVWFEHSLTA